MSKKLYVFPLSDLHLGSNHCNLKFFDKWCKKFEQASENKIIYLLGDLLEFSSTRIDPYDVNLSTHEALERVIELLEPYKDYIKWVATGNHECFDEETELLSKDGWITHDKLDENTLLATLNKDTKELEWQYPTSINKEYVKEDLIHLKGRSIDTLTTKNHRFYYTTANYERTLDTMRMEEITKIPNTEIVLRQACQNNKEDYDISDDELRLIAWCLTDSHYDKNSVVFYQRKSAVDRIIDLLDRLGISYKYRERKRKITHICGKRLKKNPEIACELTVSKKDVIDLCPDHYNVPSMIWDISKRQFEVFLDELVFCDGSKHKSSPEGAWVLYKTKEFLDQIQALCIANDIRTSMSQYREKQWKLNIALKYNRSRIKNNQESVPYEGIIYCATVPNDTLIARRNGRVIITGNSRGLKDFNYDITKQIAVRLDANYTRNDFFDKLNVGGNELVVYGKHGTKVSKNPLLAMNNFVNDMNHIKADIYMQGHNHQSSFYQQYERSIDEGKRASYLFTGHFLNYDNSYAHNKGLLISPPSFSRLQIDKHGHITCDTYYADEVK